MSGALAADAGLRLHATEWDEEEYWEEEWEDVDDADLDDVGRQRVLLLVGIVASAPLLLLYELSLLEIDDGRRNVAELLLGAIVAPAGPAAAWVRMAVWIVAAGVAAGLCWHRGVRLWHRLLRTVLEGSLAALALGPAIILVDRVFGDAAPPLPLAEWYPTRSPSLSEVGFVVGGAAYEEVCFRLAMFSALFLVARYSLSFFGLGLAPARFVAEVVGLLGSSLLFASFHLERFTALIGWQGEAFEARLFFWRVLAGMLLFALFRWRGLGVAVWTHALFNAGLVLGVGPGVLQSP